ncbi:MAG: pyridoxamine 5'-phosphate oxidase family protein [Puniceicoccales bacterium]|jgi:uncharacterized pyridoxamine 5'-phosphate oxidase family protein|nr:pyridoxamine 5'-phosphate oxidase family protein [Puniceicoccales bacterium]
MSAHTTPAALTPIEEVHAFLKKAGTYHLATVADALPKNRPFGTALLFEGKLYFQTSRTKDVSRQIAENPAIAISAFDGKRWLRIDATAIDDPRLAPKEAMLDDYPQLRTRYRAEAPDTQVLFLSDATATIEEFGAPKKTLRF